MNNYREEFPDFDAHDDVAEALEFGFHDVSWHNEQCPQFAIGGEGAEAVLFIDYKDPALREFPDNVSRFSLHRRLPNGDLDELMHGNELIDVLAFMPLWLIGDYNVAGSTKAYRSPMAALTALRGMRTLTPDEEADIVSMSYCHDLESGLFIGNEWSLDYHIQVSGLDPHALLEAK